MTLPAPQIREHNGVRFLQLGPHAVQGAMRLAVPDDLELAYIQNMMVWMLFDTAPRHIAQLGLGAAALTRFCLRHFDGAQISAAELNAQVIEACHTHFNLPRHHPRLRLAHQDARLFLDATPAGDLDVLQVDLYDAQAREPALGGTDFYAACARSLSNTGMMTVNLFCNPEGERTDLRLERTLRQHLEEIEAQFDAVVWLPMVHGANLVALAFKSVQPIDFTQLDARATALAARYKLPAPRWVEGLRSWMAQTTATKD